MEWMRGRLSWKGPYWEPRDLWVGGYWAWDERRRDGRLMQEFLSVYICLVPCLPIRLRWYTKVDPEWRRQ